MLKSSQDNIFWHFPLVTSPGHIGSELPGMPNVRKSDLAICKQQMRKNVMPEHT